MTQPIFRPGSQSTFAERTIDLRTGVRLAYIEHGDPRGLPVVFLHGLSDSWHSFESVLPLLPTTVRALVLSQRGHGNSGRPAEGYGLADLTDDVAAFLDALRIDSALIVGHSLGGTIALHVALAHPKRTIGLVLIGAFHRPQDVSDVVELCEVISHLADPIDPTFVREFQAGTIVQPVPAPFFERAVEESLKMPTRVWKAIVRDFIVDDLTHRLADIHVPTTLIWGDQDALTLHDHQHLFLTAIPQSRLIVYAGTGHAVHWEQPARTASDITGFVSSLVSSLIERDIAA